MIFWTLDTVGLYTQMWCDALCQIMSKLCYCFENIFKESNQMTYSEHQTGTGGNIQNPYPVILMTILYAWVWSGSLRLTWVKFNRDWIMSPSIWRTCGAEGHTLAQGRNNMQTSILSSYCTVDHLSSLSCTSISIEIHFCSPRQHKEWKEQLESQWERKTTSLRSDTDETKMKRR